jgi:hypothetical protein
LTTGEGSGLSVLVYAAQYLSSRPDVDVLVAAAVDEYSPLDEDENLSEGAAALVLGPAENARGASIGIEGWGMAGPGQVERAAELACAMAKVSRAEIEKMPTIENVWGKIRAAGPLFAAIAAMRAIMRGDLQRVMIIDGSGHSVSSAVILTVQEEARGS